MVFYDNYVRLCNSVRKSPSAVAIEIGIAKPTVSRWKSGSTPNHATAVKVADYFGVSVSELTGEQKETPTSQERADGLLSDPHVSSHRLGSGPERRRPSARFSGSGRRPGLPLPLRSNQVVKADQGGCKDQQGRPHVAHGAAECRGIGSSKSEQNEKTCNRNGYRFFPYSRNGLRAFTT